MAKRFSTNVQGANLRSILQARGMTMADLAKLTRLSLATINCQVGTLARPRAAWRIERVLRSPIWSSAERFRELTEASAYLDTDFVLTGFHALRRRATAIGVPDTRSITNKRALLAAVLAHARAQALTPSTHEKAHH